MLGVLLVAGLAARAQEPFDEAVPGAPYEDDFREIVVDTALFYAPLGDESSVFSRISRYGFAFTTYTPRGADDRFQRVGVAGLEFSDELGRYPDYGLYAALAALAPAAARTGGVVDGYYSPLFVDTYEVGASSSPEGMSVTCTYSERRYRGGLRFRAAGSLGRGWYLAGTLRGRWGEDAWMPGVFTEAYMGALSVEKRWREQMSLALFLMAAPQQRGLRGWTEQEVFDLTGNNRYNPYWGPYAGRMRNARVRYDRTPLAVAEWRWQRLLFHFRPDNRLSCRDSRLSAGQETRCRLILKQGKPILPAIIHGRSAKRRWPACWGSPVPPWTAFWQNLQNAQTPDRRVLAPSPSTATGRVTGRSPLFLLHGISHPWMAPL